MLYRISFGKYLAQSISRLQPPSATSLFALSRNNESLSNTGLNSEAYYTVKKSVNALAVTHAREPRA
jgi:hypothetical protein